MTQPPVPAGGRFNRGQVCRMLEISQRQLISWERQGLLDSAPRSSAEGESAASPDRGRYYTFSDLITIRTLVQLRRNGVPDARLRQAHAALKAKLVEVEKPWSELQVHGSGKNLTVQFNGATMEAITGQLLLDYADSDQRREKPGVKPFHKAAGHRRQRSQAEKNAIAERFFMAGLRYESGEGGSEKAIHAYQKAIEINPDAVGAFINLGTIYYNLGQLEASESCYQAALSIDPAYALVHFNLGNVYDERKELEKAKHHYEEAVRLDPTYPDPRYNLALVCEKLGLHGKARQQWLRYTKLDPNSEWGCYARVQLEKTSLRLLPGAACPQSALQDAARAGGAPQHSSRRKDFSLEPGKHDVR
jgi:tetratricopeptide (TPR) repeat protein